MLNLPVSACQNSSSSQLAASSCGASTALRRDSTTVAYLVVAAVLAAITATKQGFHVGSLHWIGAAVGGPVLGLGVGLLTRIVWRSRLWLCVLVGSLVTLVLTVAGAQCAMCFFIGK